MSNSLNIFLIDNDHDLGRILFFIFLFTNGWTTVFLLFSLLVIVIVIANSFIIAVVISV